MKKIALFLIWILFNSCAFVHNANKEKIIPKIITEIETDGYYFDTIKLYGKSNDRRGIRMRVFLKDGYTFYVGSDYSNKCDYDSSLNCNIENTEKLIKFYIDNGKSHRKNVQLWNWGKFSIADKKIIIQRYYNHFGEYYLLEETGKVINSNSFILLTEYDYRTKKSKNKNEFFQFKNYNITGIETIIPDKFK